VPKEFLPNNERSPGDINNLLVKEIISMSQGEIISQKNEGEKHELDKEIEPRKNYAILSEILPYSDRREIKIKFSVEDIFAYYKSKGESMEVSKMTEEWLGMVFRATASICWNMLSNNLLTFDETKILFTENIIYNFIEFMKNIDDLGYGTSRVELV
jgi:hypothetical protein